MHDDGYTFATNPSRKLRRACGCPIDDGQISPSKRDHRAPTYNPSPINAQTPSSRGARMRRSRREESLRLISPLTAALFGPHRAHLQRRGASKGPPHGSKGES